MLHYRGNIVNPSSTIVSPVAAMVRNIASLWDWTKVGAQNRILILITSTCFGNTITVIITVK